jgi:cytochrome c oxidase subunit II
VHVHRLEKLWLGFGVVALVIFLAIIGTAALMDGIIPPSYEKTIDPTKVAQTAPFDAPGLHQTGPNEYEAYVVARVFSFTPPRITVPVGAKVTFYSTSPDVVHGFFITDTDVNMLVVPGWVSKATHVFRSPGQHLLLCNEYCGAGHHFMYGSIEVK